MGLNCSKCNHICDMESQNEFQSRQKLNQALKSSTSQYQTQINSPNSKLINPSHIYLQKIIFLQKKIRNYLQNKKKNNNPKSIIIFNKPFIIFSKK